MTFKTVIRIPAFLHEPKLVRQRKTYIENSNINVQITLAISPGAPGLLNIANIQYQ